MAITLTDLMSDDTTPLLIQLNAAERTALRQFQADLPDDVSEAQAARLAIRQGLIEMGDLAPMWERESFGDPPYPR